MKKIVLLICIPVIVWSMFLRQWQQNNVMHTWPQACLEKECFLLEIADSHNERMQWLMWRTVLDDNAWMLFIFDEMAPRRKFWMKDTLISLDMVWLDPSYTIVHIEQWVPPCTADPCPTFGPDAKKSQYVLEFNAWTINELGSEIGDKVDIHNVSI